MGSPSISTHRGVVHWQRLLLLVSVLNFWSLPTTYQVNIVSTRCKTGDDVVLQINNKSLEVIAYVWYKGKGVDKNNVITFFTVISSLPLIGPEHDGRQIVTEDGSLLTKQVTTMDAGMYTVVAYFPDLKTEIGYGQLDVYEHLSEPILLASRYSVRENEDEVVLSCYTKGVYVEWLFNDKYQKFKGRKRLTADSRKLTINPVLREDAGDYKCRASNPIMSVESEPLHLHVLY